MDPQTVSAMALAVQQGIAFGIQRGMQVTSQPLVHWTVYVTAFGSIFAAIAASSIAGYFAFQNWKTASRSAETARMKLKMDLFERRLTAYDAAQKAIRTFQISGKLSHEGLMEYWEGVKGARWLFGEEIRIYLHLTLWRYFSDHDALVEDLREAHGDARATLSANKFALRQLIISQADVMDQLFAQYLQLEH